jgi:hypothetical protein
VSYAPSPARRPWMTATFQSDPGDPGAWHLGEGPSEPAPLPPLARSAYRRDGFLESVPFLLLGLTLLGVGIWVLGRNPVPSSPVPLWTLFVGSGTIAIVGGIAAAVAVPSKVSDHGPSGLRGVPSPASVRAPSPREGGESEAAYPEPAHVLAAPPRGGVAPHPSVEGGPAVRRTVTRMDRTPLPADEPPELPDEAPALPPDEPGEDPEAVARDLDDLAVLVRGSRRRSSPSARNDEGSPEPPDPKCHGCDRAIPAREQAGECKSCGRVLCGECLAAADQEGRPGLCPICGLIEGPSRARSRD